MHLQTNCHINNLFCDMHNFCTWNNNIFNIQLYIPYLFGNFWKLIRILIYTYPSSGVENALRCLITLNFSSRRLLCWYIRTSVNLSIYIVTLQVGALAQSSPSLSMGPTVQSPSAAGSYFHTRCTGPLPSWRRTQSSSAWWRSGGTIWLCPKQSFTRTIGTWSGF